MLRIHFELFYFFEVFFSRAHFSHGFQTQPSQPPRGEKQNKNSKSKKFFSSSECMKYPVAYTNTSPHFPHKFYDIWRHQKTAFGCFTDNNYQIWNILSSFLTRNKCIFQGFRGLKALLRFYFLAYPSFFIRCFILPIVSQAGVFLWNQSLLSLTTALGFFPFLPQFSLHCWLR